MPKSKKEDSIELVPIGDSVTRVYGDRGYQKYNFEDLIKSAGGCGRYQLGLTLVMVFMKTLSCWSIYSIIYASAVPPWTCMDDQVGEFNITWSQNCTTRNGSTCSKYRFDSTNTMNTLVSEWDLVCDLHWVPSTIASVQMAGQLVGNLIAGHISEGLGRKKVVYLSLIILILGNGLAFLASSWKVIAVARCFLGIGGGLFLASAFVLVFEMTSSKWRARIEAMPSWALQECLFIGLALVIHDWAYLHLVTMLVAIPFCATWCFVKESARWLMVNNRTVDAEAVIHNVAAVNMRHSPSPDMIQSVVGEGKRSIRQYESLCSAADLFRTRDMLKLTACLFFEWFTASFVTYAMQYAVPNMSGIIYLNLFLFALTGFPVQLIPSTFSNIIGRQRTVLIFFCMATFACLGTALSYQIDKNHSVGKGFAIFAFMAIQATLPALVLLTVEAYPTVVRNVAFGYHNTIAKVGAILSPQAALLEVNNAGLMYFMCFGLCAVASVIAVFLPETKDVILKNTMDDREEEKYKQPETNGKTS